MPDGTQNQQVPGESRALTPVSNADLMSMPLPRAVESYAPRFAEALPDHIPLARFKRTIHTALSQTPSLANADRRSLFNACVRCAQDGLYPDGREAALVPFEGKVVYLPMVAGIRKRMRNSGEVLSAIAEAVYSKDHFRYVKGDEPRIEHEPPALDQDRGALVGAYAIIKLTNGETIREIMGAPEIERIRALTSRNTAKNNPWDVHKAEMYRKTVLKRASKSAPISSDLDRLLGRDDEEQEQPREIPPRPRREDFLDLDQQSVDQGPSDPFQVIDDAGEVREFTEVDQACAALQQAIEGAEDDAGIARVWTANAQLISDFREAGLDAEADGLAAFYAERLAKSEQHEQHDPRGVKESPSGEVRPEGAGSNPAGVAKPKQSRSVAASTAEFDSADAGSSPAATANPDGDFWSRPDLHIDAPLRPGTSAINLPMLRDVMCNIVAGCPMERTGRLDEFLEANKHHLARLKIGLKDEQRKQNGADDVRDAVAARREELGNRG